jgi:septal ring factor EnvC (AmiA/AmiB activator)
MSRWIRGGAGAGLALLSLPGIALAGDPGDRVPEESRRLDRVREEIARLQALVDEARDEEKGLLGDLHRMDLEMALHGRQIALTEAELSRCRAALKEASREAEESRTQLESGRRLLSERVKAMYLAGPVRAERLLMTSDSPAEVISAYRLAERAAAADRERVAEFRQLETQWRATQVELEEQKRNLAALRGRELARRKELGSVKAERARMLSGLRQETSHQQVLLDEMVDTEKALADLVRTLTEGGNPAPGQALGFGRFRGLLPWPVPGKLLVPFGAQKSTKFETLVPHPGIEIAVTVGEPIHAVHDGEVAFSDWFKGYGNLIVLDHGDGYMSVYAHASERKVATGERVGAGEVIASAGDTGSLEGPRLFFEILKDGKPENPVVWLTRR